MLLQTAKSFGLLKTSAVETAKVAVTIESISDGASAMSATIAIAAQQARLSVKDLEAGMATAKRIGIDSFKSIATSVTVMGRAIDVSLTKSTAKIYTFTAAMAAAKAAAMSYAATAATVSAAGSVGGKGRGKGKKGAAGAAASGAAVAGAATATTGLIVSQAALIKSQNALTASIIRTNTALAVMTTELTAATGAMLLMGQASKFGKSFAEATKPVALLGGAVAKLARRWLKTRLLSLSSKR